MNVVSKINYFFRKSPLVRTSLYILILLLFIGITLFFTLKVKKAPQIHSINPSIGTPGDLVIIKGKNFGDAKNTNYVEFGGNKITSSAFLSWTDTEIKLILPANVSDGLVFVGNKDAKSKPSFFANASAVPVAVAETVNSTLPEISTTIPGDKTPIKPKVGELLIIHGMNFGNTRENSKVYFSTNREKSSNQMFSANSKTLEEDLSSYITANEDNFDYEYWSDSEIRVRIPDGAQTGFVLIQTKNGLSSKRKITIEPKVGTRQLVSPKTYVIQVAVDIEDFSNEKDASIILRCPSPFITSSQSNVEITEIEPEPIIKNFQHTVIHQSQLDKNYFTKKKFYQNYAITSYETITDINPEKIGNYSRVSEALLENYLKQDECVPCEDESVIELANKIVGKRTNPYTKAKLIYDYMLDNFVLLQDIRTGNISPLDIIRTKKGDAYDFAITYTALLRASGVPAVPNSGIIIDPELKTKNHWWCEFYIPEFGWVPVDIALAAGVEYNFWVKNIDVKEYYFGNLDAQHIVFSRGYNEIKPSSKNNKTIHKPRTYALQSIWEESNGKNLKYSSYWYNPEVIGVY